MLSKFARKDYRDGYMQGRVRAGIAYQIQALRRKFGVSQTEFAAKLQKPQSVISRLENTEYGKVTVQTLLDVASSLDVALLVQFVSYPDFLQRTADMSDKALQAETIHESLSASRAQALPFAQSWEGSGVVNNQWNNRPLEQPSARTPSAADAYDREDSGAIYKLTAPQPSLAASAGISAKPSFQGGLVQ
jgi:transcriptional regulator with XRE-family HTH domain